VSVGSEPKTRKKWKIIVVAFVLLTAWMVFISSGNEKDGGTAATPTSALPVTKGRIAFTSDRDGHAEIYVMNADGTDQTRLTNNSALDIGAAWSPE
jgi:hypothetical protein